MKKNSSQQLYKESNDISFEKYKTKPNQKKTTSKVNMKNAIMVVGRHIFAFLISKIDEINFHLKSIFESILRVKQKI